MGREIKILLALLGLLAGVFMGVVSLKLLVPRPPAGTGPDIHAVAAATEPQALVEPPALEPPLAVRTDNYTTRSSRFAAPPASEPSPPPRDPFVMPASFETAIPLAGDGDKPLADPLADLPLADLPLAELPLAAPAVLAPATLAVLPIAALAEPPAAFASTGKLPGNGYITRPGDSWWTVAEQAYGDGRLYRALFAWNRSLDPRVSLVPGTQLEIPPAERLGAAWPDLLPAN